MFTTMHEKLKDILFTDATVDKHLIYLLQSPICVSQAPHQAYDSLEYEIKLNVSEA